MKLSKILERLATEQFDKNLLNSNPSTGEIKKFNESCSRIMKHLKNYRAVTKEQLHTEHDGNNLFATPMIRKSTLTHHLGEYNGNDFLGFTKNLAQAFEKAGFNVRRGYGVDDIKGYEIYDNDKEVIGEIDFLESGSIPNMGNLVIFKHKKI